MQAEELKDRLRTGETLILLDVREPDEITAEPYFVDPLKTYLNLPIMPLLFASKDELKERIFGTLGFPETTEVVTLCHTGGRSERAAEQLKRHGWYVESLDGGVLAWGKPL